MDDEGRRLAGGPSEINCSKAKSYSMDGGEQTMTTWLDVTTLLSWNRPPVGIVRTEYELAKHSLRNTKTRFARFDQSPSGPNEVSRYQVSQTVARLDGLSYADKGAEETINAEGISPPAFSIRQIRRVILTNAPLWVRKLFAECYSAARAFSAAVSLAGTFLAHTLGPKSNHSQFNGPGHFTRHRCLRGCAWSMFNKGDKLLSAGPSWEYLNTTQLAKARASHEFEVRILIYDLIPIKYPGYFPFGFSVRFRRYMIGALQSAETLLSISKTTASDIRSYAESRLGATPTVEVVNLGCNIEGSASRRGLPAQLQSKSFIMYVSTIEARKNHSVVYEAYSQVHADREGAVPDLLFVGMRGWKTESLLEKFQNDTYRLNKNSKRSFHVLEHVNDAQLLWLYENALFTVFPSFYEGWGLPVAESQAMGTPVVISNGGALPEASQGLARELDPRDLSAWKQEIEKLFFESGYLETASRSLIEYETRSWNSFCDDAFAGFEE